MLEQKFDGERQRDKQILAEFIMQATARGPVQRTASDLERPAPWKMEVWNQLQVRGAPRGAPAAPQPRRPRPRGRQYRTTRANRASRARPSLALPG